MFAVSRLGSQLLFEVAPYDPATIAGSALALAAVAAVSAYRMARIARRSAVALRTE